MKGGIFRCHAAGYWADRCKSIVPPVSEGQLRHTVWTEMVFSSEMIVRDDGQIILCDNDLLVFTKNLEG